MTGIQEATPREVSLLYGSYPGNLCFQSQEGFPKCVCVCVLKCWRVLQGLEARDDLEILTYARSFFPGDEAHSKMLWHATLSLALPNAHKPGRCTAQFDSTSELLT
eukprot:3656438-Amphidinium_carterae.1